MAKKTLRILCIHGIGHGDAEVSWQEEWREAIALGLTHWNPDLQVECRFPAYDDLFEAAEMDLGTVTQAILKLSASGIGHGLGDMFRRRRAFGALREQVRWTAGMVAQWAADAKLRERARKRIRAAVDEFDPAVVCAHSLGSLLAYDLFARDSKAIAGRTFVSFGSQIGNPFVRSTLGGRVVPLPKARQWFHLYNSEDDVFTAPLSVPADNFRQVETYFDVAGFADHTGDLYLHHDNTVDAVWRSLALPREPSRALARGARALAAMRRPATRRALLVGINDYPNPENRLDGCVNDVFRVSEVLQEQGFDPSEIRVALNERATAQGIRERLEWLLDGTADGDVRFFYYSGHGAQIPSYGEAGEVDSSDECLVAYDFDWSEERAVTDDWFAERYSQLPYDAHFLAVLDCCHSGGMTRNGLPKARGVSPPDDVRHRSLRWDPARQMWVPRQLALATRDLVASAQDRGAWLGADGATRRLGRGSSLWTEESAYREARKAFGHQGPFAPLLLQACMESEYAYEYRHGVTSFGAFTYAFSTALRQFREAGKAVSFEQVVKEVAKRLAELKYDQHPQINGPRAKRKAPVPFLGPARGAGRR